MASNLPVFLNCELNVSSRLLADDNGRISKVLWMAPSVQRYQQIAKIYFSACQHIQQMNNIWKVPFWGGKYCWKGPLHQSSTASVLSPSESSKWATKLIGTCRCVKLKPTTIIKSELDTDTKKKKNQTPFIPMHTHFFGVWIFGTRVVIVWVISGCSHTSDTATTAVLPGTSQIAHCNNHHFVPWWLMQQTHSGSHIASHCNKHYFVPWWLM